MKKRLRSTISVYDDSVNINYMHKFLYADYAYDSDNADFTRCFTHFYTYLGLRLKYLWWVYQNIISSVTFSQFSGQIRSIFKLLIGS